VFQIHPYSYWNGPVGNLRFISLNQARGIPEKSILERQSHVRASNQHHNSFVAAKTVPEQVK